MTEKQKQKALRNEQMRQYKALGHTMGEVAAKFNVTKGVAQSVCQGIAPQIARPEIYRNQYTKVGYDAEAHVRQMIVERIPNFEYVGGYTGADGYVDIRCKTCNKIIRKSMVSVKHGTAVCTECEKEKQEEKAKKKAKEKEDSILRRKERKYQNLKGTQMTFKVCAACGSVFYGSRSVYCSDKCLKVVNNAVHKDRRVRKLNTVIVDRTITLQGLSNRDKCVCWICKQLCDWDDYIIQDGTFIAGNMYPSIDHVKPLSKGGLHSWKNVRLAHRICNSKRGNHLAPVSADVSEC